jgi:F-box associated protein
MKRVSADISQVALPQTTYRDLPYEIWGKILPLLKPLYLNNFSLTCKDFNIILDSSWRQLFQNHFPTSEKQPHETDKEAYCREYLFPLCPFRTECEQIGEDISLPCAVEFAQHKNRLYIGRIREFGILDLVNRSWIKPFKVPPWKAEQPLLQIAAYELGGRVDVLALHYSSSSLFQMAEIDNRSGAWEHQLPIHNRDEEMIALGITDRTITVISQLGFIYVGEVSANGAARWKSIKLSFAKEEQELESPDCHFSNGRLIILESQALNVFNAVNGQLLSKIEFSMPKSFFRAILDDNKLVMVNEFEEKHEVQFSYVDLNTKKMHTRPIESTNHAFRLQNSIIHYLNGKGRLVMCGRAFTDTGLLQYFIRFLEFKPQKSS